MITSGSYRKKKRSDGSHYWQITIELPKDPITGKRVRRYKSIDGGSKRDAERAMHEKDRSIGLLRLSSRPILAHECINIY